MPVKARATYSEESDEVEVCATGQAEAGAFKVSVSACDAAELDVDEIVRAAGRLRRAVDDTLKAVSQAVEKLVEAEIEFDGKLVEALARRAVEEVGESVTVRVERAGEGGLG